MEKNKVVAGSQKALDKKVSRVLAADASDWSSFHSFVVPGRTETVCNVRGVVAVGAAGLGPVACSLLALSDSLWASFFFISHSMVIIFIFPCPLWLPHFPPDLHRFSQCNLLRRRVANVSVWGHSPQKVDGHLM